MYARKCVIKLKYTTAHESATVRADEKLHAGDLHRSLV